MYKPKLCQDNVGIFFHHFHILGKKTSHSHQSQLLSHCRENQSQLEGIRPKIDEVSVIY